jgi:hypothetical protein
LKEANVNRRIPALVGATALLAATLAGCTGTSVLGGCTPEYVSGDSSSLVTATGKVGSAPKADFPTPLVAEKKPEVSVVTAGDGTVLGAGSQVDYDFTLYDGENGDELGKSGYDGAQFSRTGVGIDGGSEAASSVSTALECMTVGSRIALVTRWSDVKTAFAAEAADTLEDAQTVVVVIDALQGYLGKADGFNQLPADGMPTVVTAVDGTPGVSVLLQTVPKTSRSSTIKGGDGATLKADEKAVVMYSLWTWPTKAGDEPAQVGTTWSKHQAVTLALTDIKDGGGVPTALLKGLLGQKVGSQVLVVMAPGDDSFPAGQGPASDDSTYIFVVDILGIQK